MKYNFARFKKEKESVLISISSHLMVRLDQIANKESVARKFAARVLLELAIDEYERERHNLETNGSNELNEHASNNPPTP